MKTYYVIIFLQLILITQESELNIRNLKKTSNKKTIEAGISIITILGCILFIIFFISNKIRKRNLQRTITTNLCETEKQLNLKKKEYLFQNELKPKILKLKMPENYFNECAICLDNIKENDTITNTPCNHIFHFDCFKKYMFVTTDTHCPLCKFDFFSILNGKEIDFENINIDNSKNNYNKIENFFINNLPSFNDINNDNSNINDSKMKNNNSICITYDINTNNVNINEHLNKNDENNFNNNQINEDINNSFKKVVIPINDNNNKENNSNYSNEDIFFSPIIIKKKGIEINDEGDNEISTTSKLRINNYNKRKIILFSDEEKSDEKKSNINNE